MERRVYSHIVSARLVHIPRPLPYQGPAIVARLRETDDTPENRPYTERRNKLETDLEEVAGRLERPGPKATPQERRERRLAEIWRFLRVHSERTQSLLGERERQRQFNTALFFLSDLPSFYLTDSVVSVFWEAAALAVSNNALNQRLIHRLTGRPVEEVNRSVFMKSDAPLREVDRAFRGYQARFRSFAAVTDRVLEWRDALEYYVDLFSASDIGSFRTLRRISTASLDQGVITELAEGLREATAALRQELAASYSGGLSGVQWAPRNDPFLTGFVRLELEADAAG